MPPTSSPRRLLAAALLGLGLGLFSSLADRLPADTPLHVVVALGNAIGPWVAVAFVAGAVQGGPRHGAAGGTIALATGVGAYYVAALLTWAGGTPTFLPQLVIVWLLVASVAGSALGGAGGAWATNGRGYVVAPMLLGGALLAEAAYRFIEVEAWTGINLSRSQIQVAAIDVAAAVLVPILLLDRGRRPLAYAGSVALAAVGVLLIATAESLIKLVLSA